MNKNLIVRLLTHKEYSLWDEIVNKCPHGTIFQTSLWLSACEKLLGTKLNIYAIYSNYELKGGCPIFEKSLYKFISIAQSTGPMTPYGGYIFDLSESRQIRNLESSQRDMIYNINIEMERKFKYISIVNSPGFIDIRPFISCGWNEQVQYTYALGLNNEIERTISKKARNSAKKAAKLGFRCNPCSDPDIYYELFCKTFLRQNINPHVTEGFIKGMLDMILKNRIGEFWIAESASGEIAAAEIIIWDTKQAHRWSAASDPRFKETGAASLLLLEMMKYLNERGHRAINLMGGNRPNLSKFVTSFNPCLIPYYSLYKFSLAPRFSNIIFKRIRRSLLRGCAAAV